MRDTNADWEHLGEFEPYFGVLAHERFLRRNLTEESLQEFWNSGKGHIERVVGILRQFGDFNPRTAIDFGSGVGRLTRGMAEHVEHVTGVDISPAMIAEARSRAPSNVSFTNEIPAGPVDWINSAIVFQHIPLERGYALFQKLLDATGPDAFLSVHFTVFKNRQAAAGQCLEHLDFVRWDGTTIAPLVERPVDPGFMSMYDYDLNRLIAMMVRADVHRFVMHHTDHGGFHGVEIFARREE